MKIVAINGSPRKNGNTALLLDTVRKEVEAAGVEFQVFQPGPNVHPCMACYNCLDTGSLRCVRDDDGVNDIIAACIEADGILLASPVYHSGMSGSMKCVVGHLAGLGAVGDAPVVGGDQHHLHAVHGGQELVVGLAAAGAAQGAQGAVSSARLRAYSKARQRPTTAVAWR